VIVRKIKMIPPPVSEPVVMYSVQGFVCMYCMTSLGILDLIKQY